MIDGEVKFTQLRLQEKVSVADGLYGEKIVDQIRFLQRGSFEIYQKGKIINLSKLTRELHHFQKYHFLLHIQTD